MNRSMPNMPLAVDPTSRDQSRVNRDLTEAIRQLWLRTSAIEKSLSDLVSTVSNLKLWLTSLINQSDKITRITVADSPYTVQLFDRNIYGDTDGGPIALFLRPGVNEARLTVKNCGSSFNNITMTPNGTDLLFGVNAAEILIDSEVLDLQFETTEGWR